MNKAIKLAFSAFVALSLTSCAVEDNSIQPDDYFAQTENFSPAAQTRVVTLEGTTGQAEVSEAAADWVSVTPVVTAANDATQLEVTVQENTSGAVRSAVQPVKVADAWVFLTISQGAINIDVPNNSETDQPAFTPAR